MALDDFKEKKPKGAKHHLSSFTEGGKVRYDDPLLKGTHICSFCGWVFPDEAKCNSHICPASGFAANTPDHLKKTSTPNLDKISEAALTRGQERKDEK